VSTYFLSQLASVLVADDMTTLLPHQKSNVQLALRRGQNFRAVAEQTPGRVKLKDLGRVAMANLYKRRGSEWSPDLLPKQLQILADIEQACGVTAASAHVNAIANRQSELPNRSMRERPTDTNSIRERAEAPSSTPSATDPNTTTSSNALYCTAQTISNGSENSKPSEDSNSLKPRIVRTL
jgi:hypothetical protein